MKIVRKFLTQERMFKYNVVLSPIENLFFWLTTFRSLKKFNYSYNLYKQNGKVPSDVASIIINANFRSRGQVRHQVLTGSSKLAIKDNSNLFSEQEISLALSELKMRGFARIGILNDSNLLSELCKLEQSQVYSSRIFKSSGRKNVEFQAKPNLELDHIWYVDPEMALDNSALQQIILDPFWKNIADSYLGAETRISALRCWHSFPHKKEEIFSPENWHLDAADGLNFIKFFVLLTDVNEKSGPTSIVPIPASKLPRKFYTGRRYSDSEVNKLLAAESSTVLRATGKKGLIYVADTRLLHRGVPVVEGNRFILNWTCSVDSFGTVQNEKYNLAENNLLRNRIDLIEV